LLSYGFVGLIDTKMIRPMKTKSKRKKHSAAFKAKVGMEAILGVKTVAQIAREYSIHPVQVSQWKTVIRERLHELFESGGKAGGEHRTTRGGSAPEDWGAHRRPGLSQSISMN